MKDKAIFFLILLCSVCLAAGKPPFMEAGAVALTLSAMVLILLFMAGRGFGIQTLEITAKDELYHLLVTAVLLGSFVVISEGLDSMMGEGGLRDKTNAALSGTLATFSVIFDNIATYEKVSVEGSKMDICQVFSASITTTSCGGYSVLSSPANMAVGIVSFVLAEYSSLSTLVALGASIGMTIIFPAGLFFHAFKLTRPLGAFLIAAAFSLYVVLPLTIYAMEEVYSSAYPDETISHSASVSECDPVDTVNHNENEAIGVFRGMTEFLDSAIRYALIKGILFPIVYLLALVSGIRAVAALGGIEVDLSAISRLI